jgi:hypothetical protein
MYPKFQRGCYGDPSAGVPGTGRSCVCSAGSAKRRWPEHPRCVLDITFEKRDAVRAPSGATLCFLAVGTKGGSTSLARTV